jgi:high-affinity iron transporter
MFATTLIVFRETLEAALFIGIIAAATRGVARRSAWLAAGVLAGVLGSLAMAAGMERISAWADGVGQDLLNVAILTVALAMLAWHCVWMSVHGREMAQAARKIGQSAAQTGGGLWALAVAVALTVLREGAETVLFISGLLLGEDTGLAALVGAVLSGLAAGVLVGLLLYLGLARVQARHLFSVTNALVLLLAGSLASQLAKALVQAGLLDWGSTPVWDGSRLLANDSAMGTFLHALMGYDASPSALQLAFYVGAITLVLLATRSVQRRSLLSAR